MKFGRDKVPFQSTNTPQLGSTLSTPGFYNFTQIYFLFSHPHSQLLFETNHIFSNSVSRYPQETSRVWLFKSLWPILVTISIFGYEYLEFTTIVDIHNSVMETIMDIHSSIMDIYMCLSKSSTTHIYISIDNYVYPWFNYNWIIDNHNWLLWISIIETWYEYP